jgi:AbiTii
MSLLQEIQAAVIQEGTDIGPILLKLRLLASRLGSVPLEEWVKHESEGYPDDSPLPDYRIIHVSFTGNFSGPFGSGIRDAPIPSYLIEKFGSEKWTHNENRQSIAAIDELLRGSAASGVLRIDASNLILALQGKVYKDYACNSVTGTVTRAQLVALQHAVRTRVLELTIALEKAIPAAASIVLAGSASAVQFNSDKVTQVTNQVIYGNVTSTSIASSGAGATFNLAIQQGDQNSLVEALVKQGIPEADAAEFGELVASEKPESKDEPFGAKARTWLGENLKKAASGTWKMGVSVATEVLKQAALNYYGL